MQQMVNTALSCSSSTVTQFITKATAISYIDSKSHIKKLRRLIDYSGFISREWFLIDREWTHKNKQANMHTDFPDKEFKKPPKAGTPSLKIMELQL